MSDVNKFNWKVHLTYFKGHGKYYSGGEYTSHKEQLFEIVAEARDMARAGKVPCMVDGYKPKFMLINAQNHPHDHPALYVQDMNEERDAALRNLRKLSEYCDRLAEGKDTQEFTPFDEEVISVLGKLFDAHRDVVVPPECASLGFVLRSETDRSKTCGCLTVPCAGGKMPHQKMPDILCYEIGCRCGWSPYEKVMIAQSANDKRETNDDTC